MFWTMHTGIIAAIAVVFARYAAFFLPLGDIGQKSVATACVLAGSGYPHMIGSIGKMKSSIAGLELSDADRAALLGGNAADLLGLVR